MVVPWSPNDGLAAVTASAVGDLLKEGTLSLAVARGATTESREHEKTATRTPRITILDDSD
jgi:hypothetical protein